MRKIMAVVAVAVLAVAGAAWADSDGYVRDPNQPTHECKLVKVVSTNGGEIETCNFAGPVRDRSDEIQSPGDSGTAAGDSGASSGASSGEGASSGNR